jgi:hypothetical protein
MMSVQTVRENIASAIESDAYNTFAFPPDAPTARAVAISHGDPMIEPLTIGTNNNRSFYLNLQIHCWANAANNQSEIAQVENIVMEVIGKLPIGVLFLNASAPDEFITASAALTRSIISIRVPITS